MSAALAAVLFLLVLLLVAGWNVTPLKAAITVTVIPAAAFAGARIGGQQIVRAASGCALVGGGVLALAWLPGASPWWTVPPQVLAGAGMGLALTALAGGLLPERTPRDAARLLAIRHAGIAAILAVAAPIAAHQLDVSTLKAREQGVALVLDAPLPPLDKIKLAPALLKGVQSNEPRNGLRRAVAAERHRYSGANLAAYDELGKRADDTLVTAVGDAFRSSFLIAGAAGFLAAILLLAGVRLAAVAVGRSAGGGHACRLRAALPNRAAEAARDPQPLQRPAHAAADRRHHRLHPGAGAQAARPGRLPARLLARGAGAGPRGQGGREALPARARCGPTLGRRPDPEAARRRLAVNVG